MYIYLDFFFFIFCCSEEMAVDRWMGRSTFGAGETDLNYTSKKIVTDRKIYKAIAMLKNIVLHTFLKTIYC